MRKFYLYLNLSNESPPFTYIYLSDDRSRELADVYGINLLVTKFNIL